MSTVTVSAIQATDLCDNERAPMTDQADADSDGAGDACDT